MIEKKYKYLIIVCFILIFTGIIVVNNSMPEFVKNKSGFSVNCSLIPFNFGIDTGDYSIDLNSRFFYDISKNLNEKIVNMSQGIMKIFYEVKGNIGR